MAPDVLLDCVEKEGNERMESEEVVEEVDTRWMDGRMNG